MAQNTANLSARIDSMFRMDRLWAWGFVVALWLTTGFVLLEVNGRIPDGGIRTACWISAFVLLIFNTAAIWAMVNHYGHDKEHIYGIDIRHLDAGR